ncbi:hypothetical protein [Candidatus Protochlamydia phocaeensis]|uniref:hypothetical protein n=1 Tax=Candidatus Protochlamydia phocaeensis TaxID=1414722 RepID=UPI000837BEEA|nr:hypothetical protein [Candidatus Protochlamydia phocaeensis]
MNSKKILITSGRSPVTLDLARQFHQAGHEVYVAETMHLHICRFSNAVKKSFLIRSPRLQSKEFIEDMVDIVKREKIDMLIPIYEEALYLAQEKHRFPSHCQVFVSSFDLLNQLHNKWLFNLKLKELGMEAPETFLIKSSDDLKKLDPSRSYALKACYSRAAINLKEWTLGQPLPAIQIEPHNPWVAQEWLQGNKYCTYSICHQGVVQAHATYPVGYTVHGRGCVAFKAIDYQPILKWIERFAKQTQFTGQIAFDFIELPGQRLFAIECNPRATSGAHLFSPSDRLDKAFFNNTSFPIYPQTGYSKQLAIAMLLYGWKKSAYPDNNMKKFLKALFSVRDIVFNGQDIMPFITEPVVFAGIWMNSLKYKLTLPAFFMYDYEWNGEMSQKI